MIHKKEFYLSAGEGNAQGLLAVTRLTEMLIDIATEHANLLGIGNPVMECRNAGWVLARLTIEMESYPKVNETFDIATWIESWNRHFSERSFKITDSQGLTLGYARSVWMVMTTDTHENYGLSHMQLPEGAIIGNISPISRQSKHREIMPYGTPYADNILIANKPDVLYTFKYCDIDFYRHVNTVRYVTMILNQFTMEQMDSSTINRIELSFLHEGHYGMEVAIRRCDTSESETAFIIQDQTTSTPLLYSRIRLR